MRLELFSSTPAAEPNLVRVQRTDLLSIPTVLVCPFRVGLELTPSRLRVRWNEHEYVVACELIRPIHRRLLRRIGELDEATSEQIIYNLHRLLAR